MADHPTVRIEAPAATPTTPRSMMASRPSLPRRQSRFTEDMTEDYTPAQSIYEHEASPSFVTTSARGGYSSSTTTVPADAREYRPIELITRGMNGCTHGAACVILVAIMTEFLSQWEGFWVKQISEQAVALLVFLGMDTLLDIYSLIRLHEPWPAWALFIRLINGLVYIAMFMIYIAHGRVFPSGFTFWSMSPGFAGPIVYMFLWLLGLWNLCHAAFRRHRLGKGLRAYIHRTKPQLPSRRGNLPTSEASNRPPRSPLWRRWIRVGDHDPSSPSDIEVNAQSLSSRTTVAPTPPISLRERPVEMKRPSYPATTRTVSTGSYNSETEERRTGERDHEKDKALEGGLSPPPPVKF